MNLHTQCQSAITACLKSCMYLRSPCLKPWAFPTQRHDKFVKRHLVPCEDLKFIWLENTRTRRHPHLQTNNARPPRATPRTHHTTNTLERRHKPQPLVHKSNTQHPPTTDPAIPPTPTARTHHVTAASLTSPDPPRPLNHHFPQSTRQPQHANRRPIFHPLLNLRVENQCHPPDTTHLKQNKNGGRDSNTQSSGLKAPLGARLELSIVTRGVGNNLSPNEHMYPEHITEICSKSTYRFGPNLVLFLPPRRMSLCIVLLFGKNLLYESLGESGRGAADLKIVRQHRFLSSWTLFLGHGGGLKSIFFGNLNFLKMYCFRCCTTLMWNAMGACEGATVANWNSFVFEKAHFATFVLVLDLAFTFSPFHSLQRRCYHRLQHSHKWWGNQTKSKQTHTSRARHRNLFQKYI